MFVVLSEKERRIPEYFAYVVDFVNPSKCLYKYEQGLKLKKCELAESVNRLAQYNVSALPTTFIIKNGSLAERIGDNTKIEESLKRQL